MAQSRFTLSHTRSLVCNPKVRFLVADRSNLVFIWRKARVIVCCMYPTKDYSAIPATLFPGLKEKNGRS